MSGPSRRRAAARVAHAHSLEPRAYFAISFNDPANYPIAGEANAQPALADFNGDGFLDAATVPASISLSDNSVSVLLNKGDGTFETATTREAGLRPFQVIAGDFNNDDDPDLAVLNIGSGTVGVFPGNGDGTFGTRLDSAFGPGAGSPTVGAFFAAGDLNRDGTLDLVVSNPSESQIVTLLGNGIGRFNKQDDVTFTSTSAGPIALADFTGDRNLDVATTLGLSFALQVYFTDGNGNLDGGHAFAVDGVDGNSVARGLTTGDFNGDRRPDVAMLSVPPGGLSRSVLSVFPGTGSASDAFGDNRNTPIALAGSDVSAADLDDDGRLDAVVSQAGRGFQVFRGAGGGLFQLPAVVDKSEFSVGGAAAIGDINDDDKPDLAFTRQASSDDDDVDTLAVFLAKSKGGTPGPTTVTPTLQAKLPPAVVAGAKPKDAKVSVVVTNSGTGTLNAPVTFDLFTSTDATLDTAADTAVGTPVTKTLKINPGASKTVKLKVATVPDVAEGAYFLIARTSATGSTGGADASDAPVNISPPFIDLTGAFGASLPATLTPGKKATVPVTVTNAGNVNAGGTITIGLAARPAAGGADVPIPTTAVKVNLKPGASKTFKLKITTPTSLPSGGVFNFVATIDSTNSVAEKDEANNEVASSVTFTVN
jgi:hypothetical protein